MAIRGIGKSAGGSAPSTTGPRAGSHSGGGGVMYGGGPRATPEPGGGIMQAPAPTINQPIATPQPVTYEPTNGVHPLMVSSLPSIASGADIYSRQFYRGTKVPYRRYLPITLK